MIASIASFPTTTMRKRKLRTLKELYEATSEVFEPKMTAVLQGGYHIHGPAEDTGSALQENMESMGLENKLGRPFLDGEHSMMVETGTCNVSAIPCSSRLHVKPVESEMGMKDGKLFEEALQGKASSQCFFHDAGLLSPSKSSACNDRLHTSSETSNFFSICSSHDPLSENAESKSNLRALDVSQDVERLQTVSTEKPLGDNQSGSTQCTFHGHTIFQNLLDKQKDSECHGDDTSCISGADCGNEIITDSGGTERKKLHHASASVNSLSVEGSEKAASVCFASKQRGFHLQPAGNHFNNSDPSVVSSLRDLYAVASSLTGEPSESSMEQVESSLAKLEGMSVANSMKPEFQINKVNPNTEAVNCPDQIKQHIKSGGSVVVTNVQETPLESQHVQNNTKSDIVEDDEVKVCDICGDVGREAHLAICSQCRDGAEHVYCMRVRMKSLPGDDWMCEECMLKEQTEKQMPEKIERLVRAQTGLSLVKRSQKSSYFKNSDLSNCMKLDKKKSNENSKNSLFSAKRPMDNLEVTSLVKRQAFETSDGMPWASKTFAKTFLSRDSSSKNLGYISARVQSHLLKSAGSLLKSNSFNGKDLLQQLPKEVKLKRKLAVDGVAADGKKEGIFKMMRRSYSFVSPRQVNSSATDPKAKGLSSKDNIGDLKKLSTTKGNRPLPSLAKVGSVSSALKADKGVSSPTAAESLGSSRSKYQDIDMVSSHGTASHSSRKTSHLASRGSKYSNDEAGSSTERKSSLPLNEVGALSPTSCFKTSQLKPRQVISKDKLHKEHKFSDKCDGVKLKSRVATKDQSSLFSSKRTDEEQDRVLNDMRQLAEASMQSAFSMESTKPSPAIPLIEVARRFPKFTSAVTVPEISYIWQGRFELQRSQKLPSFCDQIQAHLSACASPKVFEGVNKFSSRVLLEEVPRFSTWPVQFSEDCAAEDNIALYFFAEDLESYGRNYKSLLEGMIENDLALRGDFDGIELLIFSSTLLPEKSQRWNNLYFLWGVFRAMRKNYFGCTPCKKTISGPRLIEVVSDENTDPSMPVSDNFSASKISDNPRGASSSAISQELPPVSFGKKDAICLSKAAFSENNFLVSEARLDQQPVQGDSVSSMTPKTDTLSKDMQRASLLKKEGHGDHERWQTGTENGVDSIAVEEERDDVKCINNDIKGGFDGSSSGFSSEIVGHGPAFSRGNFTTITGPNSLVDGVKISTPNLELSLGTEETSMQRGVPPLSRMINERTDRERKSNPGNSNALGISLTLSLALPGSG